MATNRPWWLICTGARPVSKCAKAESGTIVSLAAETGALDEAPPLLAASALDEALRAESEAMAAALELASVLAAEVAELAAASAPAVEPAPTAPVPVAAPAGPRRPDCWCRWRR